jgi:hypothetical protein
VLFIRRALGREVGIWTRWAQWTELAGPLFTAPLGALSAAHFDRNENQAIYGTGH